MEVDDSRNDRHAMEAAALFPPETHDEPTLGGLPIGDIYSTLVQRQGLQQERWRKLYADVGALPFASLRRMFVGWIYKVASLLRFCDDTAPAAVLLVDQTLLTASLFRTSFPLPSDGACFTKGPFPQKDVVLKFAAG